MPFQMHITQANLCYSPKVTSNLSVHTEHETAVRCGSNQWIWTNEM